MSTPGNPAMDRLRALHKTMPRDVAAQAAPPKPAAKRTDFATLPHLKQVMVARGAGNLLGLADPFFRRVEAIDGVKVRINGTWVTNFAAYDYLSLNRDPRLLDAVTKAVAEFGVSSMASRLVGGERDLHLALETALARFVGTEDALVTVSGHATNQGIIRTLMGPGDIVLVDALAHNSVFEGIRSSGAAHYTFAHNDLDQLAGWLETSRDTYERVLIVVEGLYSMDGDLPDLAGLIALKERHEAWLMVDEAHALGVLGATGRGSAEQAGIDISKIDIIMGTLSKTLCSCGGYVAGTRQMVDNLRYAAPGFVYSVGLSIPNAAASLAAL
ncbi:MAG: aminotransferase class I/II-fold pyridoxal phosphate-dependent enzyme, partial [Deltaproteobacteria bacterium]